MNLQENKSCCICEKTLTPLSVVVATEIQGIIGNFGYGVCHHCNFAQATLIPSNDLLTAYYNTNQQLRRDFLTTQEAFHIEKQISFLMRHIGATYSTLEYGPDMGQFLHLLKNRRPQDSFFFNEYNEQAASYLTGMGFKIFDGRKVDTIIARHVFEHIPNPIQWLTSLNSILNDKGVIFIEVPDYTIIDSANCDPFQFEHLSYFTLNSLQKIAHKSGFFIQAMERDQTAGYSVSTGHVMRAVLRKIPDEAHSGTWNLLSSNQESIFARFSALIKYEKSEGKKIAIYGAGTLSRQLSADPTLEKCVSHVYDADPKKVGSSLFGTQIKNANEIKASDFDIIFVTVLGYKNEVEFFLKSHQITDRNIKYLY